MVCKQHNLIVPVKQLAELQTYLDNWVKKKQSSPCYQLGTGTLQAFIITHSK